MKAAVVHGVGRVPRFEEFPDPVAGEGEVVVRVLAAALNNVDKMMVNGNHYDKGSATFPHGVGMNGVGELSDGTRIIIGSALGTMAEKVAVQRQRCMPLPQGIDPELAAAIFNPGLSAWFAVNWRAQVKPGRNVIVLGATGTTGSLAVQLARQNTTGRILAIGRNAEALARLLSLGADATISLSDSEDEFRSAFAQETADHQYDVVFDYLWGKPAEIALEVLCGDDLEAEAHKLRYLQIGEMAGARVSLQAALLRSRDIELIGQGGGSMPAEAYAELPKVIPRLFQMASAKRLSLDYEVVPLQDVESVWTRSGRKRIVFVP